MPLNANSGWGRAMMDSVTSVCPTFGNVFIVSSSSDSTDNKVTRLQEVFKPEAGVVRVFSSLSDAYDACTSNNNDVILLDADSTHSLSAGLAWTKNRIHVIGLDGGRRLIQQGSKVQLATAATTQYVIKVTGVRNSFTNVKFINASTEATALSVLEEGGEGSLYDHCSFVFGVVSNLDQTTAHEILAGSDSATYINCTFGSDTLLTSAARSVFHIDQVTSGQEFKSNIIQDCIFQISSSSSTAAFVRLDAVGDILFSNLFKRCTFVASVDSAGGAALAECSQTIASTVKGCLAYDQCAAFNCTDFATATSSRNAAQQILAATATAGTAGVGVQPTA